jgi:hypothetical protein
MGQTDRKTIYEVYFKSTVTYKAETGTLRKKQKQNPSNGYEIFKKY